MLSALASAPDFQFALTADSRPQHEHRNDELHQHAHDNRVPPDRLSIPRRRPQAGQQDNQPEQADGAVGPGVVLALLADEGADKDDGDGQQRAKWNPQPLWDHGAEAHARVVPHKVHRFGDDGDGHVEGHEPDRDGEPEEEGDHPAKLAVQDKACDPPSASMIC